MQNYVTLKPGSHPVLMCRGAALKINIDIEMWQNEVSGYAKHGVPGNTRKQNSNKEGQD